MSSIRNTSPLLINESPLQVLPSLAVLLGLNEAMILQQIHFWLCNKDKRNKPYTNEDETWIYNTYEEWHEQFPFWSVPTIKRAILNLEEQGILITRQFDKPRGDAKKYYRIDHVKLTKLLDTPSDQFDLTPQINLIRPSDQIDPTVGSKRSHLIGTETTTENTTERERQPLSLVSNLADSFDALVLKAAKLTYLDDTLQRQLLKATAGLIQLQVTTTEVEQFVDSREKSVPVNFFVQRFESWRADNKPKATTATQETGKAYRCLTCRDTGSISVFDNREFSHYADCPNCQSVAEAA